ncbi:hypothetical protein OG921_00655 [Aldersonia sp. NBC_00410]|uniref:hypothetical protein n=1 Tax=Aldersonia sp. NBC_00410 TaxID=2975954 RepID=UPI00224F4FC6|nr:hypothetical protein [Aldersonia sp. NBC_00410]MCX5041699.1 hypothetical protein [Aldersonia sp. NBC_00410]
MDLFDVAKSCARRWWVFLPLVAIVTFFSYHTYSGVQPVYYSSATVGLVGPAITPATGVGAPTNPLMNAGGVPLLSNLLAMGMSDAGVREQVVAQGGMSDYTAKVFSVVGGQLPLVVIEATAPDPAIVASTLQAATGVGDGTLHQIQENAGVPPDQMMRTYPIGTIGEPAPAMPSRTRSTVATFVAGFGLSVVLTVIVDVLLIKWRRRKAPAESDGAAEVALDPIPSSNGSGPSTTVLDNASSAQ